MQNYHLPAYAGHPLFAVSDIILGMILRTKIQL